MNAARLLFPAIRWDAEHGFDPARAAIQEALHLGVGGFILFGGNASSVHALTRDLQSRSAHPLLIAADLERGAGQQFTGATQLPPLAAIGSLDDLEVTRRAGELTAREARALGVNWLYAPDADVDAEPRNPIIGTRSFSMDADTVARHVVAWIEGCHQGGALATAKHFPGHGRTTADSHAELPVVAAGRSTLERDLEPFRAAIQARVDAVMTAHIAFPALDDSGTAATLSAPILTGLLRRQLGFEGIVVTDAMIMKGVLEAGNEASAALAALRAGCDALLYPENLPLVAESLERAAASDAQVRARSVQSSARIDAAARRVAAGAGAGAVGLREDREYAAQLALRAVHVVRGGTPASLAYGQRVVGFVISTVDDDLGGQYAPPSREQFPQTMRALGYTVFENSASMRLEIVEQKSIGPSLGWDLPDTAHDEVSLRVIAVYCDIRAWKGRPGLSDASRARVRALLDEGAELVVLFGHPRLAHELPGANVLCAWGGEAIMQQAAAHRLCGQE